MASYVIGIEQIQQLDMFLFNLEDKRELIVIEINLQCYYKTFRISGDWGYIPTSEMNTCPK